MALFVCDECNHIANTAPDRYWEQLLTQSEAGIPPSQRKYLCSQCRSGTWHGLFPRTEWDGKQPMKNRGKSGPDLPDRPEAR